jgi:predicted enzyme related to lactoylglutathione lyase
MKKSKPSRKTKTAPKRGAKPMPVKKSRASVTPIRRVTGIGGFFFKSETPKELMAWYHKHLGIAVDDWGGWAFQWREKRRPQRLGATVFNPFPKDTTYFDPSESSYMFNLRVADLLALLAQLRREGVHVIDEVQEFPYGKFGWIIDPEGRKIELWEPPDQDDPFAATKEVKKKK